VAGLAVPCTAAAQQPGWLAHQRVTVAIGRAFKNPNKSVDDGRVALRFAACFRRNVDALLTEYVRNASAIV